MKRRSNSTSRRAFTLIELLVVVSIIALLVSILMPALSNARKQARSILCRTRVKDLGLAFNMYALENNDAIPDMPEEAWGRWVGKIVEYYDGLDVDDDLGDVWDYEIFNCPAKYGGKFGLNTYFTGLYRDQESLSKQQRYYRDWRYLHTIKQPSELPLIGDTRTEIIYDEDLDGGGIQMHVWGPHPKALDYGYMGGVPENLAVINAWRQKKWIGGTGPGPNHNEKCSFLFADWHVESRDVCTDGKWPWFDHEGTAFHPVRRPGTLPPHRR